MTFCLYLSQNARCYLTMTSPPSSLWQEVAELH